MKTECNGQEEPAKAILPQPPTLPVSKSRDRLALALQRGWLKPVTSRHLATYVIESRAGLPWRIRVRDWILMSLAWIGWGLLVIDAADNSPRPGAHSLGADYWIPELINELLFALIVADALVLVLALFGTYTLYRFRNPRKEIPEPEPLRDEELAECCGLDTEILKEWHMARSLTIDIDDQGQMAAYKIFPQGPPEDVIL